MKWLKASNFRYVLLIIILGLVVYARSLANGFVWDDLPQIVQHQRVHDIKNFWQIISNERILGETYIISSFWRPLMLVIFSAIYTIFGDQAFYFHFFSLILHIANSILLFLFFKKFFKVKLSYLLSIIFLVHPLNSEAVLYISALNDPLFFFFGIAALLYTHIKNNFIRKLVVFLLLFLGLLSKEPGILFVIVVGVYLWFFIHNKKEAILVPMASVLGYLFLRFTVFNIGFNQLGLDMPMANANFLQRLITIPNIIYYYLSNFFYPLHLWVSQGWIVKNLNFINAFKFIFLMTLSIFGLVFLYQKNKINRHNYLFWLSVLGIGISPYLQLIPLEYTVADRWFYFPMIGLLGVIGYLLNNIKIPRNISKFGFIFSLITVLFLSVRSYIRAKDWKDNVTLFYHDARVAEIIGIKGASQVYNNLAIGLINEERFPEAEKYAIKALESRPDARYYNNLGVAYFKQNNYDHAIPAFENAIKLSQLEGAYVNLSILLINEQKFKQARDISLEGLQYYPQNWALWKNLARSYYELGDLANAIMARQKAESLGQGGEEAKFKTIYK